MAAEISKTAWRRVKVTLTSIWGFDEKEKGESSIT